MYSLYQDWAQSMCSSYTHILPRSAGSNWQVLKLLSWTRGATKSSCEKKMQVSVARARPTLCDPMDHSPPGSSVHGIPPGKNTGVDCASPPGDLPDPGIEPRSPASQQILYLWVTRAATYTKKLILCHHPSQLLEQEAGSSERQVGTGQWINDFLLIRGGIFLEGIQDHIEQMEKTLL